MSVASGHRADIDALRAAAIGLVVGFHARLPGFDGGYLGVDVFFVVSGFLITGLLLADIEQHGTIRLARFWTRRIRRLLPASTLVLVATAAATVVLSSPLAWRSTAEAGLWAAAYAENLFLAADAADYFAPETRNPFVHYWSLAIEEQFYVVWPLLLLAVTRLVPAPSRRRSLAVVLGLVAAASLAHSIALTAADSTWAYYSPLSRAWEFAAGGLLVLAEPTINRFRSPARSTMLVASGGAILCWSLLTLDGFTPFPGWRAVPPVLGTLAVLAAAVSPASPFGRLAGLAPVQWLGRISYGWYLWHVPMLVLAEQRLTSFGPAIRIAVALGALAPAAASLWLVENPIRFHPGLARRTGANVVLGVGLLVVSLTVVAVVDRAGTARIAEPRFAELAAAVDDLERVEDRGCPPGATGDDLRTRCVWGDPAAERVVLVLGDSHADQWLPALDEIGRAERLRILVRTVVACPALPSGGEGVVTTACERTQDTQLGVIDDVDPDLVVVTQWTGSFAGYDEAVWRTSVSDLGRTLGDRGIDLLWIHDPPSFAANPIDCLGVRTEGACRPPASEADTARFHRDLVRDELDGVAFGEFDPIPLVCDDSRCLLRRDGVLLYRDSNHLTATAARTFVDELAPAVLGSSG